MEQIKKPLENYRDIDAFKIYVSDLGLLAAKKDLAANDILYMVEELNDFKGGMAENYVHVQLTINGYQTYYWVELKVLYGNLQARLYNQALRKELWL